MQKIKAMKQMCLQFPVQSPDEAPWNSSTNMFFCLFDHREGSSLSVSELDASAPNEMNHTASLPVLHEHARHYFNRKWELALALPACHAQPQRSEAFVLSPTGCFCQIPSQGQEE